MSLSQTFGRTLLAAVLVMAQAASAAEVKLGIKLSIEGDGFFLNPIVSKITVKEVAKSSPAEAAGIVVGDEITQIEGQNVVGRRARDLQSYMELAPGEARTLRVKHANGEHFDAKLIKPKE
jgi:C-terminal processing protease CtpA/Prc